MSEETLAKLQGHIRRTGRYEAIVVRPIGVAADGAPRYQILNGHHRVKVLQSLGRETARCDVWDVDDREGLILMATLNRLAGEDEPAKRDAVITELLGSIEAERLADLLPESAAELADLARTLSATPVPDLAPPEAIEPVEFLYFALTPAQRRTVEDALQRTQCADRAAALVALAQAFATQSALGPPAGKRGQTPTKRHQGD
jgi:hypothetical protein